MRGLMCLGKFQMILKRVGTMRISGHFAGKPGLERKRYRQFRFRTRRNETLRGTSRKTMTSARDCTSKETPSITHDACSTSSRIITDLSSGDLFFHPGCQTTQSKPCNGSVSLVAICLARVDLPEPALPVTKMRFMFLLRSYDRNLSTVELLPTLMLLACGFASGSAESRCKEIRLLEEEQSSDDANGNPSVKKSSTNSTRESETEAQQLF